VKDRLGAAGARLGQSPPQGIARARRAFANRAVAHEVDIGMIVVCRPVKLEIVEKCLPIKFEAMCLEIAQRK
jgi:hypothetical protein